jgi:hypothetical protein
LKLLRTLSGIVLFFIIFCRFGMAQDYLWPTDASHFLTSSFAEYRPGHFHAGIDIKTWGRIGYKVFAIRDGYITRIGVSPYGYGKVLYQKLDTGEIVVYAHLDRFNNELQSFVKAEQRRKGAFRINNYLGQNQFPVKQRELIGYTGASGIGSPHLHFEIRDPNNNPINPFLLGYKVDDTIPPTVDAISITPLDFYSRVNSDVIPLIEKPIRMNGGSYQLATKPLVSGNIGFAIDCSDQANGVNNSFAVYKLDFYVDGALYFSATYDKFSYGVSNLIDLDRDFRLMSRGKGRFQKLYKEKFNQLPFYKPGGNEIGVISCDPNSSSNALVQNWFGKGEHQFIIQLYDFFGNLATVVGSFLVGERRTIYADYQLEEPDQLYISNIREQHGNGVENPEIFVSFNQGISWRKMALNLVGSDSDSLPIIKYLLSPIKSQTIVKIQSVQDFGIESFPSYYLVKTDSSIDNVMTDLSLEKDFYDDYIRLTLSVNGLIQDSPKLLVQQIGIPATEVSLWQIRFNEFIGIYQLASGKDGPLYIEANAIDLSGRELTYWEQFEIRTVFPNRGGSITSKDGLCRAVFSAASVYKNLFLRIENQGPLNNTNYDFVGEIYEITPQDVPLKSSATVEIKYPSTDELPDKLGIYQVDRNKPGFRGNDINFQKNAISCNISNLGALTLIRDTIPPYVEIQRPGNNTQSSDKKPTILAVVYDELSGIANELSIVMKLDGKKLIAEFDPDARTIKFEPDDPLSPGEHTISVWAIDNSKNEASVSQKFYILE